MKLEDIGFYTLSDARAARLCGPMMRCEMLLTARCNFNCPYCRKRGEEMPEKQAVLALAEWAKYGLKNVRFSGGEPTMWGKEPDSLLQLVRTAKMLGVERVAISTNGSAPMRTYADLIEAGVDDFSVSLDACCASTADMMAGVKDQYERVLFNIRFIVQQGVYTTVGVVATDTNISELLEVIEVADNLGVDDIRVISAAQEGAECAALASVPVKYLDKYPILKYRAERAVRGLPIRGIVDTDTHKCPLVLDDSVVSGNYHYPCVIYLREGGSPIGVVCDDMQAQREWWFRNHDTHEDPICKNNCLDVCVAFNNKRSATVAATTKIATGE